MIILYIIIECIFRIKNEECVVYEFSKCKYNSLNELIFLFFININIIKIFFIIKMDKPFK